MSIQSLNDRSKKLYDLIRKYSNEMTTTDKLTDRYVQIKAYIHCFKDELNFLNNYLSETSQEQEEDSNDSEFGDDDY